MRKIKLSLAHVLLLAALGVLAAVAPAAANGYDFYPSPFAWSPDSTRLLAAWSLQFPLGEGAQSDAVGELRLYYPGSARQTLVESMYASSPCWHPDGQSFAAIVGGSLRYYLLGSPDAGRPVSFGALSPRYDLLDCSFNPRAGESGQPLLFFSAGERFYGSDIFSYGLGSGEQMVLDLGGASALSPLPLPGGELIFLAQGMDGFPAGAYERVMLQAADSGVSQFSLPGQGPEISPADYHECYALYSRRQNEILFQRGGWGDWAVYSHKLDSGEETLVLADAQQPSLSADGRFLAFTRRDPQAKAAAEYDWELPSSVWLLDRECGAETRVSADGYYAEAPSVSPDGSWVAWLQVPQLDGQPAFDAQPDYGQAWPPEFPAVSIVKVSDITKGH